MQNVFQEPFHFLFSLETSCQFLSMKLSFPQTTFFFKLKFWFVYKKWIDKERILFKLYFSTFSNTCNFETVHCFYRFCYCCILLYILFLLIRNLGVWPNICVFLVFAVICRATIKPLGAYTTNHRKSNTTE